MPGTTARIAGWLLAVHALVYAAAAMPDAPSTPSAKDIVERNLAARGGLDAWRRIETMSWVGHVEAGAVTGSGLPFLLEMKRPNKTRFVINAPHRLSMRVFDGKQGWKLRITSSGRPDLEPYSADETAFALEGRVIDGPLLDYQASGTRVALEGVDEIDGREAYRLEVKRPSGSLQHVWIDAQSFLEVKGQREFRDTAGRLESVTKLYRNYRDVDGLQVPFLVENSVGTGKNTDRMVIDSVFLNPPIEDRAFGKPNVPGTRQTRMTAGDAGPRMLGRTDMSGFSRFDGRGWSPRSSMRGSAHVQ